MRRISVIMAMITVLGGCGGAATPTQLPTDTPDVGDAATVEPTEIPIVGDAPSVGPTKLPSEGDAVDEVPTDTPAPPTPTVAPANTPAPPAPTVAPANTPAPPAPTDVPPADNSQPEFPLLGTRWQISMINGEPRKGPKPLPMTFEVSGRVTGDGGCNGYGGNALVEDDRLTIDSVISTMMACADPALQDQEQQIFRALAATQSYRITETTLHLIDGQGIVVIELVR